LVKKRYFSWYKAEWVIILNKKEGCPEKRKKMAKKVKSLFKLKKSVPMEQTTKKEKRRRQRIFKSIIVGNRKTTVSVNIC